MKSVINSLVIISMFCSTITPSLSALSAAEQRVVTKIDQTQQTLDKMQANTSELNTCILNGTCSPDKKKRLLATLKVSVAALGALVLAILAATAAAALSSSSKKQPASPQVEPEKNYPYKPLSQQEKESKLFAAILTHNTTLAEDLIVFNEVNPNIVFKSNGLNALSMAAEEGDMAMVKLLLSKGAQRTLVPGADISQAMRDFIRGHRESLSLEEAKSNALIEHNRQLNKINR